jgi:putative peptidoglycan lipid II flippase
MSGVILASGRALPYPAGAPFIMRAAWVAVSVLLGCASYAAATAALRCPEWGWIRAALARGRDARIINK